MNANIIIGMVSLVLVTSAYARNGNGRTDNGLHRGRQNRERVEVRERYQGQRRHPVVVHRPAPRVVVHRPAPRVVVYRPAPPVVVYRPAPRVIVRPCPPAPSHVVIDEPCGYETVYPYPGPRPVVYENPYDQVGTTCGTTASVATGVGCGERVVHQPSNDKVRRRNGILIAAAINEIANDSSSRQKDIRKGAIAATILNEIFTR